MAYFDTYGWYTTEVLEDRVADVEPANKSTTTVSGELRANWTGYSWIDIPYSSYEYLYCEPVPEVITMRQARLALLAVNLLATVDEAVATGTDEVLKVEWEYATEVRRDWVNLINMATSLGMTEEQLDDLFIKGSKL